MRCLLLAGLTLLGLHLGACGDETVSGTLMVKPDSFVVVVGGTTFIQAFVQDGMTADPPPVDATWTVDPEGIVKLEPYQGIQKVTGLAAGQVVVTASAFTQTAKTGMTVTAP